jgi:cobaltochelatase CobN
VPDQQPRGVGGERRRAVPLDAATQVAIPEFDGRIITVPFSFKEIDEDGLPVYVADPSGPPGSPASRSHARLRHIPPAERRIVLMLSAYPTKHSRIGNAVGLDTPASDGRLLRRCASTATTSVEEGPGSARRGRQDGDALIHALIAAGGQDPDWLTEEQLPATRSGSRRRLPRLVRHAAPGPARRVERHWGPAPGELFVDDGEIVLAALRDGNVVVMVQPPRGFGENPVAIYHDPDLPPSHHYLAAYRWLADEFGAHAVVHVGKHGNLEWLPGKNVGHVRSCGTDAALGDLPLIYPFLVNDPGEGTQAKRRAHATLVDHLIPPMARAESVRRHRPAGAAARRARQHRRAGPGEAARDPRPDLDPDPGRQARPRPRPGRPAARRGVRRVHPARRRLAVRDQGRADPRRPAHPRRRPTGEARVNLVLAMLRARQMWGGRSPRCPGCARRSAWTRRTPRPHQPDAVEEQARALVAAMEDADWAPEAAGPPAAVDRPEGRRPGGRVLRVRRHRGRAAAGAHHRRARPTCCTPSTAATSRPGRAARRCAA